MKALVTDDSIVNRVVLRSLLSPYGIIHTAVNGKECFELFKKAWEENEPFDLICLDIVMPELDGPDALNLIRSWEDENSIINAARAKVIMISGIIDRQRVPNVQGYCDGYLIKPVEGDTLRHELHTLGLID